MNVYLSLYLITLGLSFLVSLLAFYYNYPSHLKSFAVLLGVTFVNEIVATQFFGRNGRNMVYNCFMLVEYSWYAWYYRSIIKSRVIRSGLHGFLILLPLFWFACFFIFSDINQWSSLFITTANFFIVCMAMVFCYEFFLSDEAANPRCVPELWIAIGMLLLYSCQIPFFGGIMNYLSEVNKPLASSLLNVMIIITACMYLLFTYAFLCQRRSRSH